MNALDRNREAFAATGITVTGLPEQYINDHLDESAEYLADKLGLKAEDFKENWKNYNFEDD